MNALVPVRTVAPTAELLSLAGAKAHLRVEGDDEDGDIEALVADVAGLLDGYSGILGQALLTQTWAQSFDRFPYRGELRLPLGPLGDTVTIAYFDAAGAVQAFTGFHAVSDAIGPLIILPDGASWPATAKRPDAVTVTWTCGHASSDAPNFPPNVIRAVKLLITHWYENRGPVNIGNITSDLSWSLDQLISPHRKVGL